MAVPAVTQVTPKDDERVLYTSILPPAERAIAVGFSWRFHFMVFDTRGLELHQDFVTYAEPTQTDGEQGLTRSTLEWFFMSLTLALY